MSVGVHRVAVGLDAWLAWLKAASPQNVFPHPQLLARLCISYSPSSPTIAPSNYLSTIYSLFRKMPGLDLFSSTTPSTASTVVEVPVADAPAPVPEVEMKDSAPSTEVAAVPRSLAPPAPYYNPRLDPKNFLEGPLSWNPATRLRQMLARPGIVVRGSLNPTSTTEA